MGNWTGKVDYSDNFSWTRKTINLINELLPFRINIPPFHYSMYEAKNQTSKNLLFQ